MIKIKLGRRSEGVYLKKRRLHVYLLLIHLRSGDVHIHLLGAQIDLAAGIHKRVPDSAVDLPGLGFGGFCRLRVFARWTPAVPPELRSNVVERH